MCLNAHIQASTSISPNELTFGQRIREPLDVVEGIGTYVLAATEVSQKKLGAAKLGLRVH